MTVIYLSIPFPTQKPCQKAFFRENQFTFVVKLLIATLKNIYVCIHRNIFSQYLYDSLTVIVLSELLCASDKNKWDFVFTLFFVVSSLCLVLLWILSICRKGNWFYSVFLLLAWILKNRIEYLAVSQHVSNILW